MNTNELYKNKWVIMGDLIDPEVFDTKEEAEDSLTRSIDGDDEGYLIEVRVLQVYQAKVPTKLILSPMLRET